MRLLFIPAICSCLFVLQPVKAADRVEVMGDFLQVMIPAIGYAETFYKHDTTGRGKFYTSFITTVLITHALKYSVNAKRPNGSDRSFPSGHTSSAFQGAAFIHARYGVEQAIPAYLAACFVGYSRVESHNHYPRDVAAGAAIGVLSNFYFNKPEQGVFLGPLTSVTNDYGVELSVMW